MTGTHTTPNLNTAIKEQHEKYGKIGFTPRPHVGSEVCSIALPNGKRGTLQLSPVRDSLGRILKFKYTLRVPEPCETSSFALYTAAIVFRHATRPLNDEAITKLAHGMLYVAGLV